MAHYDYNKTAAGSTLSNAVEPAPMPGTLPALLNRADMLTRKAEGVQQHCEDIRIRLLGVLPEGPNGPGVTKTSPNGFIEEMNDRLDGIEKALMLSDKALETLWAKIL